MAGANDKDAARADAYTKFDLYREDVNVANDNPYQEAVDVGNPAFDDIPVIDLSKSMSGYNNNSIFLMLLRTDAGTHTDFKVRLYGQITDAHDDIADRWILLNEELAAGAGTTTPTSDPELIRFTNLYAAKYKVLVNDVLGGVYNIYESHTAELANLMP
jgi:hypothetical protein